MSQKIYSLLQSLIPELKQPLESEQDDFYYFRDWLNQDAEYFHYIELNEYFDNGINENEFFKKLNVNVKQLNKDIDQHISNLFEPSQAFGEVTFDTEIDHLEQIEKILFDQIKKVAVEHKLSLLVVYRENPYWLVLPSQNQHQLEMIVQYFNQAFNDDGDLNMAIYG